MGLDTSNAGAVVAGGGHQAVQITHVVRILKGTFIHSVGRDVKADDVVEISDKDYRFLKPYNFCEDAEIETEIPASVPAETEAEIDADELEAEIKDAVEEAVERVESKRRK